MKKLLSGMLFAVIATSCIQSSVIVGSGREAKGAFKVSLDYTELSVSSGIVVEFIPSLTGEGTITADEEVLDYVSIVEEGRRVKISYEPSISVHSDIETVVSMPFGQALALLDVSSAAKVTSADRLRFSSVEIDCSSAGTVALDMDAQELVLDITSAASFKGNLVVQRLEADMGSAGKCTVEGSADYCRVENGSASSFRGAGLLCRRADARASSGASIEISATDELDARASSGGSVRYKGSPSIVKHNTSSGGSVRNIN
jgi:hypothetical protein